jgi:type I restriction enzyme S subunit
MTWPTKKLGEVCKLQNGFAFKSSEYIVSGLFVMRIANVQDGYISLEDPQFIDEKRKGEFKIFLLKEGDILISLTGNIGRVGVINLDHLPAVLNQRVGRIVPTDKIDRDYLFYFLRSPKFFEEVTKGGHGMAQQNISTKDIANLEIPLPPLAEQKKIVKKIEELFAKIDAALEARKEAKQDVAMIMQKALDEVFEKAKEKGWKDKKLGEICEINPRNKSGSLVDETEVSFVPMRSVDEVTGSILTLETKKFLEVKKGYTPFIDRDVIFAKITPCMENGKAALVSGLLNGHGFGSTEFHVLRSKGEITPELVYYYVRRQSFRDEAEKKMTGSAGQKRVPKEFLANSKIFVPPLHEQKKIVARLDGLSEKVQKLETLQDETERDLKALKRAILERAFAGKLV